MLTEKKLSSRPNHDNMLHLPEALRTIRSPKSNEGFRCKNFSKDHSKAAMSQLSSTLALI